MSEGELEPVDEVGTVLEPGEEDVTSTATVRYDGDAIDHVFLGIGDRDENGLFRHIDGIGDTMSLDLFSQGMALEILNAHRRKENHGVYVTVDEDVSVEELYDSITDYIDNYGVNPRYEKVKRKARFYTTTAAATGAAVYAGWETQDIAMGVDMIEAALGYSLYNVVQNAGSMALKERDAVDALDPDLYIEEIETIPSGEHTYAIEYHANTVTDHMYNRPLEEDGADG